MAIIIAQMCFHALWLVRRSAMAGNGGPATLAYIIIYVPDVNMAAEFYNKAFGLEIRAKNHSAG